MGAQTGGTAGPSAGAAWDPGMDAQMFGDRTRFEEHVIGQLGFNPFMTDPVEEVNKATADLYEDIFNRMFAGRIMWRDRNRMTPEQQQEWNSGINAFRSFLFQEAKRKKEQAIESYDFMMSRFDHARKEKEAAYERLLKTRGGAGKDAPATKELWDEEQQRKTLWKYNPETESYENTGQPVSGPDKGMPAEVTQAMDLIKWLTPEPNLRGEMPELSEQDQKRLKRAWQIVDRYQDSQLAGGGAVEPAEPGEPADNEPINKILADVKRGRQGNKVDEATPGDAGKPSTALRAPTKDAAPKPEIPKKEDDLSVRELRQKIKERQKKTKNPKDEELYKKLEQELTGSGEGITVDITLDELKVLDQFVADLFFWRPVAATRETANKIKDMIQAKSEQRETRRQETKSKLKSRLAEGD